MLSLIASAVQFKPNIVDNKCNNRRKRPVAWPCHRDFRNSATASWNNLGCSSGIRCPESGIIILREPEMPALITPACAWTSGMSNSPAIISTGIFISLSLRYAGTGWGVYLGRLYTLCGLFFTSSIAFSLAAVFLTYISYGSSDA